ncbi:glutamate racemase [Nitratifractor sp.]|uniref:glutamate racemase n=1 Tax=Nitratifractor sp. TaxID=2268144 RepID=UPI0025F3A93D|nr:glutamate racemase [Nitratifractor sp.]
MPVETFSILHSQSSIRKRICVFDSGLGGLTVVRSIRERLPGAEILYLADTAHAPYGEKSHEEIRRYSLAIARFFVEEQGADALVVACNTATSAAIATLRERYGDLPIVGTEPGIKPALGATRTGKIGVMATPATLAGEKYQALVDRLCGVREVELFERACPGLVEQIEAGAIDAPETRVMLEEWLAPMRSAGVDTIVLGCTHYPLAAEAIRQVMEVPVILIETGEAIARRLATLLGDVSEEEAGILRLFSTGAIDERAVERIVEERVTIEPLALKIEDRVK